MGAACSSLCDPSFLSSKPRTSLSHGKYSSLESNKEFFSDEKWYVTGKPLLFSPEKFLAIYPHYADDQVFNCILSQIEMETYWNKVNFEAIMHSVLNMEYEKVLSPQWKFLIRKFKEYY